ncbi:MAG TPA: right-handed parallel beta-helix repeat-containing protein [Sedimentisphaerales bacterium]|nr:right-handed parallel beta-helix repeat-containing protein [Sedimentisphaerales bacterium]
MKNREEELRFFLTVLAVAVLATGALAETVYVDARSGSDGNPGTKDKPVRTVGRVAEIVNSSTGQGPTTIKIAPGIYNLTESVEFGGTGQYTEKERLVIEAIELPDDPQWKPALMPVILSTEDPRKQGSLDGLTATSGIKIAVSHVTIRGLKFLGNPLLRNWHNCISRIGDNLDDLLVTQCMFIGDRDVIDIYCAALATGDRFVVDHCIFRNCHACTVFWDGPRGIAGKGCSMRYCIVDGAYISGVWTCQTAEDFEFHHNIITRSEYFWIRKRIDNPRKYQVHDCIITGNESYSGYGVESGPTGRTGDEVTYEERNIIKQGTVVLGKDKKARNYLHPAAGSPGSDLGAGLFKIQKEK